MNIELIWAQDQNGGIGKDGKLPWHISEDLQNFKKITSGFPIVMGRKTWESLPFKPLPGRRNIVLSSQIIEGVEVYSSIENCCKKLKESFVKKIFIIGGQSIYDSFYPKASTLHLTIVKENVEGIDAFFPVSLETIKENFQEIERFELSKKATYINLIR